MKGILESPQQGGDCLADFIAKTRSTDSPTLCDLSTVLPAGTDNCAKMRSPVNWIIPISPLRGTANPLQAASVR